MADEFNKDEKVEEQLVEETPKNEEEKTEVVEEVVEETAAKEETSTEEATEEEAKVEEEEKKPTEEEGKEKETETTEHVEEEKKEEEVKAEDTVEETSAPVEEVATVEETTVAQADLDEVKKQLAEKEAELEEEKAIKSYEDDVREANRQLDAFLANLGNAMAQEFAKYGIDVNANIDELRKTDPAKAQVAENIINQAQAAKAQAMTNMNNNLNERLTDVVFNKAARLFDKFNMTPEQSDIAAETFVNILGQSGIRDINEDLVAKVELAVARAKMIKPKVEKVVEEVKEIAKDTVEAVKDVIEETSTTKEEAKEEQKKEEETDAPVIESVVEAPSIDEFKEGAVTSNQAAGDSVTIDNVLDKMAALPFKDRVRFYAEHKELAEEAMAKKSNAESRRRRI